MAQEKSRFTCLFVHAYIAPAPAVYAAQAPHCASTGILLEAFNSPTVYVAIQTLLSLYGSRERSAVCTRVDAVSVMSLSGPSFLEVVLRPQVGNNIIFHAGAQFDTILSCRQCSDVPCTQPFGSYPSFLYLPLLQRSSSAVPSMFSVARKEYHRRARTSHSV